MIFWDRLFSVKIGQLPNLVLPGRFSLSGKNLKINGLHCTGLTQLHCGTSGQVRIGSDGTSGNMDINLPWDLLPDSLIRSSISDAVPESLSFTNIDEDVISSFVPLVPRVEEKIQRSSFELILPNKLGFLEMVCQDPITLLKIEVEKVHTDRAKRVPVNAVEYLASHAEDWSRRTVSGVEPIRVLSEIISDEYNIYENRVAATLINRLYRYLLGRIQEIEDLKGALKEQSEIKEASLNTWHRNRVYDLWGDAVSEDAFFTAENTQKYLQGLARRVGSLMESMLYLSIPGRQRSEDNIIDTNIIANDQNYREVALLLNELNTVENRDMKQPDHEIYHTRLKEIKSFENFCNLLILRVFVDFGYSIKTITEQTKVTDCIIFSAEHQSDITVHHDETGVLRITNESCPDIVIVPIFAQLSRFINSSCSLDELSSSFDSNSSSTPSEEYKILLYPDKNEFPNERLLAKGKLISGSTSGIADALGNISLVHVSPFSFYNIERVGSHIRQWMYGAKYSDYPRSIEVANSLKREVISFSQSLRDSKVNGALQLLEPIAPKDINSLEKHIKVEMHKAEGKGRDFNSRKMDLQNLHHNLKLIMGIYNDLLMCPVCHEKIDQSYFSRTSKNTYRCRCTDCDTIWGIDACSNCKQPFPFIRPAIEQHHSTQNLYLSSERRIGLDMIALPCCTEDRGQLYVICSRCGYCGTHGVNHLQEAS